jgi:hypothetical protein
MRERKMAALFSASGRLATQKYSTLAFSTTLADSTSHRVHRVLLNEEYANLRMQHCWISRAQTPVSITATEKAALL